MGGTSFDASLIIDGLPSGSNEAKLEGLPVQMSVVDIHVIGAGGGSIAWEEAGAMRVGPQSAGSMPGPACYGLGGTEPTVSDANLVLGRLDGANFSGGEMALDRDAAVGALQGIGDAFGLTTEAMAQGVVDVVNAKMADAIRTITVQRGIDPRDFSLVAFGGAGPAQAGALAEELQIREVIVPVHPGAFSAWGMLQTDVRHDYKETLYGFWDLMERAVLESAFAGLEEKGRQHLLAEGIAEDAIAFETGHRLPLLRAGIRAHHPGAGRAHRHGRRAKDLRYGVRSAVRPLQPGEPRRDGEYSRGRARSAGAPRFRPARAGARARGTDARCLLLRPASEDGRSSTATGSRSATPWRAPRSSRKSTATTLVPPGWQATAIEGGHISMTLEAGS